VLRACIGMLLMEVRSATATEHSAIRALLSASLLPVADLGESDIAFLVAHDGHRVIGAVGLQPFDEVGLLRSLVVDPSTRGAGVAARLVGALELDALGRGIQQLALLTQTAEDFFSRRGYVAIDRAAVSPAMQASAEFSSLCPASATCMAKFIGVGHDA